MSGTNTARLTALSLGLAVALNACDRNPTAADCAREAFESHLFAQAEIEASEGLPVDRKWPERLDDIVANAPGDSILMLGFNLMGGISQQAFVDIVEKYGGSERYRFQTFHAINVYLPVDGAVQIMTNYQHTFVWISTGTPNPPTLREDRCR